jgi:hypothetical protein
MVPGGLLVTSSTTRFTSRTSLVMRVEIRASTSYGMRGPVGGHRVLGRDRPQDDRVAVRPAVALDADRPHVGEQHHRALPDVAVQAGGGELLAGDGVGLAQQVEPLLRHLADDPDAEARAGERLAPHDRLGQAELDADRRTSSLNSARSGSTSANCRSSGRPPTLWWLLMLEVPGAAARLDDVGVERALHEELDRLARLPDDRARLGLEDADELPADRLALGLGSVTPASASRKRFEASATRSCTPVEATKSCSTCSASPLRSRPWSTKTQVSWSPTARCTSAAATAESTPPDSPQTTRCRRPARGSRRPSPRRC